MGEGLLFGPVAGGGRSRGTRLAAAAIFDSHPTISAQTDPSAVPETTRLLCTGDLHLGRRPARAPAGDAALSVENVWSEIVRYAIDHHVDAVILTGDIADHANHFYEAFGAMKREVERLVAAGIPTFAVAGNHDHDALPRLADALDSPLFNVLGRNGQWEPTRLAPAGRPPIRLVGWSFPALHHARSPLDQFPALDDGPPTIALLHADLDVPGSRYAPVAARELLVQPVDVWLLGHQHGPRVDDHGGRFVVYPGSPQPLRPPETGARGPCLVTRHGDGRWSFETVPLATLRYAPLAVDLTGVEEQVEVRHAVTVAITDELRRLADEQPSLQHVVFRVALAGRTAVYRHLAEEARRIEAAPDLPEGRIAASVERVVIHARPAHDLQRHAGDPGPSGELARLILALEADDGHDHPLAAEAAGRAGDLLRQRGFIPLRQTDDVEPPDARGILIEQGLLLLDTLLEQTNRRP